MYIQHCFGIVINSTAIIGNNSHFSQLTSIGANTSQAARVGDNVYFGPGSIVIDNVEIGTGACIGGGAVVVKNVKGNTVVGGVPAKELNTTSHPEYIRHPYKEEWLK
jgi:serine acetyltransferase